MILGHADQKRHAIERQEGLRSQRMTLDQIERIGQCPRLGLEERNPRPAFIVERQPRQIVMAPAQPRIDQPVGRPQHVDQIAEGPKGLGRQRLYRQPFHPILRSHFRPEKAQNQASARGRRGGVAFALEAAPPPR